MFKDKVVMGSRTSEEPPVDHRRFLPNKTWLQAVLACSALLSSAAAAAPNSDQQDGGRYINLGNIGRACSVTQVGIYPDVTTIAGTIYLNPKPGHPEEITKLSGILYRRGDGPWLRAPISDEVGSHSLTRLPNGRWLINDGQHNRMVEVGDLSSKDGAVIRYELGGVALFYPHDQVVDPDTGYIYVIDGERLYRFKDLEGKVDVWTFSRAQLHYARSLSWFDGHLHIIHTSRGEVFRIDDFDKHLFTVFKSPRPRTGGLWVDTPFEDVDGGALDTTGLVLDSVKKSDDGWYYGSNDFSLMWAMGGNPWPARLIRWRTWQDFEQGKWEALSAYIPPADVPIFPYFLTIYKDVLYAGTVSRDTVPGTGKWASPCGFQGLMFLDLRAIGK